MTGSSSRPVRAWTLASAAFVGVWVWAGVSGAQAPGTTGPVTGAVNRGPLMLVPSAPDGSEPLPPPAPTISVGALEAPHPDSMGLVDASRGGFPDTLWQGSQPETARTVIAGLPPRYATLSSRRLAQRLLLSAAPAPAAFPSPDAAAVVDASADAPPANLTPASVALGDTNGAALLEARIVALTVMGDWRNALALIDLVPISARSPTVAALQIDGLLIEGRVDTACGEAQRAFGQSLDAQAQKLQIFCQLYSGQTSGGELGLSLLREQGVVDKTFFWAADALQGGSAPVPAEVVAPGAPPLSALSLAMLRKAGRLLPETLIARATPTELLVAAQIALTPPPVLAADPAPPVAAKTAGKKTAPVKAADKAADKAEAEKAARAEDELRLVTVEHAVAAGVMPAMALRAAYAKFDLRQDSSATGQIAADTARQRAGTYQLALAQSVSTARAEVLARAMDLAHLNNDSAPDAIITALVYAPFVAEMLPGTDLAWFAGAAARILLAADSVGLSEAKSEPQDLRSKATAWIDMASSVAETAPDGVAISDSLWPYRRLLSPPGQFSRQELQAWQAAVAKHASPPQVMALRETTLNLLTAGGDSVTAADWEAVLVANGSMASAPSVLPAPVIWQSLTFATESRQLGPTVALSLQLLSADKGLSPLVVTKALQSLSAVGRVEDARNIALELAVQRGL